MVVSGRAAGGGGEPEPAHTHTQEESGVAWHVALAGAAAAVGARRARCGVWSEHSYARAGAAATPAARRVRHLLAVTAAPPPLDIVVDDEPEDPPALLLDEPDPIPEPPESDGDDDWEARVAASAPTAAHARLAAAVVEALRDLRLATLAAHGRPGLAGGRTMQLEHTRRAARRIRQAAAGLWVARGGAGPWLETMRARLPVEHRVALDRVLAELRALAPRLGARVGVPRAVAAAEPACAGRASGPLWAVVVGATERWCRALSPLCPVRAVPLEGPPGPPDTWCSALMSAARARIADAVAEAESAGAEAVVVGAGAGAVAVWALGAASRKGGGTGGGALPPLRALCALGAPISAADGNEEGRALAPGVAALVVCGAGAGAAAGWRGAVVRLALRPAHRVLLVEGADGALRLPYKTRARLALPQRALDAAIADEVYRWAAEVCEGGEAAPAPDLDESTESAGSERRSGSCSPGEESPGAAGVVSRGTGATPLALQPPRRAAPPDKPLAAADIMQLPIVFADDEAGSPPAAAAAPVAAPSGTVTVRSGGGEGLKYTRVIVAKRPPLPARPLLVRRAPRTAPTFN